MAPWWRGGRRVRVRDVVSSESAGWQMELRLGELEAVLCGVWLGHVGVVFWRWVCCV